MSHDELSTKDKGIGRRKLLAGFLGTAAAGQTTKHRNASADRVGLFNVVLAPETHPDPFGHPVPVKLRLADKNGTNSTFLGYAAVSPQKCLKDIVGENPDEDVFVSPEWMTAIYFVEGKIDKPEDSTKAVTEARAALGKKGIVDYSAKVSGCGRVSQGVTLNLLTESGGDWTWKPYPAAGTPYHAIVPDGNQDQETGAWIPDTIYVSLERWNKKDPYVETTLAKIKTQLPYSSC